MDDFIMRFITFLIFLLTPILILYGLVVFVTWGEYWNPGTWMIELRAILAVMFSIWLIAMISVFTNT